MNLYEILEINEKSGFSEIKKAFIKKIKNIHPDKNEEKNTLKTKTLIEAYKILSNENLKKQYDESLKKQKGFKMGYKEENLKYKEQNNNYVDIICNQCSDTNRITADELLEFNTFECISCNYNFFID